MMILKSGFVLISLLVLMACGGSAPEKSETAEMEKVEKEIIRDIDVQEASTLLERNRNILLIDVRTPDEYTGPLGHIEGSQLLPVQQFKYWGAKLEAEKDQPIMLVCRSGGRSGRTAVMLKDLGYTNLMNIKDGMSAWNKAGLPIAAPE